MKKLSLTSLLATLLITPSIAEKVNVPQMTETAEEREERTQWFRDAKFGLFIHWGPAAISGEEISWGMKDRIEGGDLLKRVPRETYMNLYKDFNPTAFDADYITGLAKEAGMKYLVFVTKHHDGFSLWPTKEKHFPEGADYPVHYSIADTPYAKDPVRMVQEAAQKHDLKLGWYYSTRDWTHPDYLKGDNATYNDYYENQVEELMKEYGPVDIMWFDHCFGDWDQYTIPRLYEKMYSANPNLLVNNRAVKGIKAVPEEFDPLLKGDYDTPENRMGAFQHGRAWESCMILTPHPDHGGWSYRPDGTTRSLTETIQLLSSCVTGDGNMLLNIAPLPDGSLRAEEEAILKGIAPWMEKYGEAIYDTRGGPWINGSWGGATYKDQTVYLHLFNASEEQISFNRLPQNVVNAETMTGQKINFEQASESVSVTLPAAAIDPHVTVIKLTLDSAVSGVLYGSALHGKSAEAVPGTLTLDLAKTKTFGDVALTEKDGSPLITNWANGKDYVQIPLELNSPGTYTVRVTSSAKKAGATLTTSFGKYKNIYYNIPGTIKADNFQTFDAGKINIPNADNVTVTLRPANNPNWSAINIKKIELVPSN